MTNRSTDLASLRIGRRTHLAVFALLLGVASAQETTDVQFIKTTVSGSRATLQVTRTVPLRRILEVICERAKFQCELVAVGDDFRTGPLTIDCSWSPINA